MKTKSLQFSCAHCGSEVVHESGPHMISSGTELFCPRCNGGTIVTLSKGQAPEHSLDTFITCLRCGQYHSIYVLCPTNLKQVAAQSTNNGLCAICGGAEWTHSARDHEFSRANTSGI